MNRTALVRLLGRPAFHWDGRAVSVPVKLFGLMALLAAAPGGTLARDEAVARLWGPPACPKANASFRQFLVRIRRIEDHIGTTILSTDKGRIGLGDGPIDIDLRAILALKVSTAIANGDLGALERFVDATDSRLLEGSHLPVSDFADWLAALERRIANDRARALAALIDGSTDPDDWQRREQLAHKLLEADPAQELGYRVLMESCCQSGNRTLARRIYRTCAATLLADYGAEPELATRQLAASLGLDDRLERIAPGSGSDRGREAAIPRAHKDTGDVLQLTGAPRVMLLPPRLVVEEDPAVRIAAALVEDITAGLTRYRSIAVLAPQTGREVSLADDVDEDAIGQRYGVHYLVTTSIKPRREGHMATFMLVNARTKLVLTAVELPFRLDDLAEIFSRVGSEVVQQLVAAIERNEIAFPSATRGRSAYRLFLEGRRALWRSDLPDLRRARGFFQKSIGEFDRFAPAFAGLSRTLSMERLVRSITSDDLLVDALELAERSIRLDPLDGRGLRERGFSNLYLRRHDESLASFDAAAVVNPNDADMLADYADALAHAGMPERALTICLRAKALNPAHPDYYDWILGSIYYQMGRYENAVEALSPLSGNPGTARLLAACTAMSGDQSAARRYAKIVIENYPDFQLESLFRLIPDKNMSDTRHLLEGLQRAGFK